MDNLKNQNIILRYTTALECLGMFVGYLSDPTIYVYSLVPIDDSSVNELVLMSFDGIETVDVDGFICTSFSQTVNDMLSDSSSDRQALLEALSDYYYAHNNTFDGLEIYQRNKGAFENVKSWAIDYYTGG